MIAALIAAAMPTSAPAEPRTRRRPLPDASPALWVVNDEDTIIYLFGTFHALDGKIDWFNDEVRTAFGAIATSWCSKPSFPRSKQPPPRSSAGPGSAAAGRPVCRLRLLPDDQQDGHVGRPLAGHVDRSMAPTRSCAKPPTRSASRSAASKASQFQLGMFGKMPGATPPSDPAAAARTKAAVAAMLTRAPERPGIAATSKASRRCSTQMQAESPETYQAALQRPQRTLGGTGSRAACSSRASSSSPSARAISPARTASSTSSRAVRHPHRAGATERSAATCAKLRPLAYRRALPGHGHPWRRGGT